MLEVGSHPNIELITYSEITDVKGHIGNFEVKILKKARFVKEDKCTGCGACAQICPIQAPNEFNFGYNTRKAIYSLFPQAVPLKYTIDKRWCIECRLCVAECKEEAIDFDQKPEELTINVGTIIVASGFKTYDPTGELGFGKYDNVITQLQLERILSPNGPTFGELRRISDDKVPKKILMVQCVGSRSIKTNEYCSAGVCCLVAIKNAGLLKTHDPDADLTICYMDMRTPGKAYEEYYKRMREMGIKFLRGNIAEVKEDPKTKNLLIRVEDTLSNKIKKLEADLVVLSVAMEPSEGTSQIANILRLERSPDGFIKEFHQRLNPVGTKIPGIYIAGVAQGPKAVDATVNQGKGAAAEASIPMKSGVYEIEMIRANVNDEICSRCGQCILVCPYQAISMENFSIKVDTMTCRGCGACAAICKNNAMTLKSYGNKQFELYIDNLFAEMPKTESK